MLLAGVVAFFPHLVKQELTIDMTIDRLLSTKRFDSSLSLCNHFEVCLWPYTLIVIIRFGLQVCLVRVTHCREAAKSLDARSVPCCSHSSDSILTLARVAYHTSRVHSDTSRLASTRAHSVLARLHGAP